MVTGYNFGATNSTAVFECQFGNVAQVRAELIANDKLKCTSPMVLSGKGYLTTYLQIFVNYEKSFNSVPFSFYGLCPANKCENIWTLCGE